MHITQLDNLQTGIPCHVVDAFLTAISIRPSVALFYRRLTLLARFSVLLAESQHLLRHQRRVLPTARPAT